MRMAKLEEENCQYKVVVRKTISTLKLQSLSSCEASSNFALSSSNTLFHWEGAISRLSSSEKGQVKLEAN